MSFKIKSVKVVKDTLITEVVFTLKDDAVVTVDVPHFMPYSEEYVLKSIANREASEQLKHDAITNIPALKTILDAKTDVTYEVVDGEPKEKVKG